MKIIKFLIVFALFAPWTLMAQNGFLLQGKLNPSITSAKVYLSYYKDGNELKDSTMLKKGQFTFKGNVENPLFAILMLRNTDSKGNMAKPDEYLYFYLENAKITVESASSFDEARISGSRSNAENEVLIGLRAPYRKVADSIKQVFYSWTPEQKKDTLLTKPLGKVMKETQIGYDSVSRIFIAEYPNSFIALYTFNEVELGYNFNPDTAERRFAHFSPELRQSKLGQQLLSIIDKGKKTNIGAQAMDFVQPDSSGRLVKLADFRGQYVLVDFWASWCTPCRAENPNLLKAYNKFKSKKFTILGVSLDDPNARKAWLHAVAQDGMPWTQVSELKGFKSQSAVDYGVQAIPTNYLISPEGVILAKNLRGEDLDKKLGEILGF